MTPREYNIPFFEQQQAHSYRSAEIILPLVNEWIRPSSVIDVGCGVGAWLKVFQSLNVSKITGLDGDYVPINKLLINRDMFIITDLESKINIDNTYDLAMCLEVAEHLSNKRAGSFVQELCNLSNVVLFSAAIPGQEGTMHINEQYPDYWIDLFNKNGYECFDCLRPVFWNNKEINFWYKQNIMLFINNKVANKYSQLNTLPTFNGNSFIHPDLFKYKSTNSDYYEKSLHNPVRLVRYYLSKMYHSIKK